MTDNWILIADKLPPTGQDVWLFNELFEHITIGGLYPGENDDFCWSALSGDMYVKRGKIVCESEQDDYEFTHWQLLPDLPKKIKSQTPH